MIGWKKLAMAGAVSLAAMAAAAPAGAITLILGPSDLQSLLGIASLGTFNLSPYLHDGQGRTFQVTSATLSAFAHSDPHYGPLPTTTTVDTPGDTTINFGPPPSLTFDVSRVVTTTFTDDHADGLTLSNGLFGGQSVSGTVSQVLDDTQTTDGGSIDGPADLPFPSPFPITQHTTITDVTIHHALYGDLDLGFDLDAAALSSANLTGEVDAVLMVGFNFNFDPNNPFGGLDAYSQFDSESLSLSFDRIQTGGPPPDAPASGAPEPAAWALMLGGFGLAGAALRRRRRAQFAS